MCLILSNAYKGLLRDQIINPPKWWYHLIEEIIDAPDYNLGTIIVPMNSATYYSMKERSNYDPKFDKLMKRLEFRSLEYIIGLNFIKRFYGEGRNRNNFYSAFLSSNNWELHKIMGGNNVVTDEVLYDLVHDVRFIRKDFQFSKQMVKL